MKKFIHAVCAMALFGTIACKQNATQQTPATPGHQQQGYVKFDVSGISSLDIPFENTSYNLTTYYEGLSAFNSRGGYQTIEQDGQKLKVVFFSRYDADKNTVSFIFNFNEKNELVAATMNPNLYLMVAPKKMAFLDDKLMLSHGESLNNNLLTINNLKWDEASENISGEFSGQCRKLVKGVLVDTWKIEKGSFSIKLSKNK
ncbi:MAG: hypothetical protein WAS72_09175 [Saprospiraceae bacterium]